MSSETCSRVSSKQTLNGFTYVTNKNPTLGLFLTGQLNSVLDHLMV